MFYFFLLIFAYLVDNVLSNSEWINKFIFCLPAAKLTSLILGMPCEAYKEGYYLTNNYLPLYISGECSAISFFVITFFITGSLFLKNHKFHVFFLKNIHIIYVITIFTNTLRIICCWKIGILTRFIVPENYSGIIHLSTGVSIFLTLLVLTYFFYERRINNE